MCDSHLHTLGGKREDLDVNISYSQHSSLLLLYSTLSAVLVCMCGCVCTCVCFSHCTCLFLSPSSLLSLSLTAGSPPRLATGPDPSISLFFLPSTKFKYSQDLFFFFFCTDVDVINRALQCPPSYLLSLSYLSAFMHPEYPWFICHAICANIFIRSLA